MPVVADTSPCPGGAFEHLMHTAFTDRVVVLRSLTHDVEVQLPPGTAVPGTAEQTAEPADDQRPWWFVPGVDDMPSERPAGPDGPIAAVQQATGALLERTPTGAPANVAALFALSEQLRGLALAELAEMHATGSQLSTGAPTAASWLRQERLVSDVASRAEVRLAGVLRHELPGVGRLLREGRTTLEHARAAVAGTRGLDVPVVQDSDQAICTLLGSADPPTVRAHLRERAEAVSPELGRETERRAHDRRGLTVDQIGTSGAVLGGALGVEDAEILLQALDLQTTADRADGDSRSLRQRRADVIVQWARQAAAEHGGQQLREDLRTTRSQLLRHCTPLGIPPTGARPTRSTSAAPPASSPPPNGAPSSPATGTASFKAADADPCNAKPTTSGTGSTAAPPTSTTSSCSASNTITTTTTAATTSHTATAAGSPRPAGEHKNHPDRPITRGKADEDEGRLVRRCSPRAHALRLYPPSRASAAHELAATYATSSGRILHERLEMSTLVGMAKKATVSEVRAWAKEHGFQLGDRGRLPAEVWQAWEDRATTAAVPQPRTEVDSPAVTADDLDAAQQRIAQLERQVGELAGRLATLEQRAAEPRRLFARSR